MAYDRINFYAAQYMPAAEGQVVGGYVDTTSVISFSNSNLSANINDRLLIRSSHSGDFSQVTLTGRDAGGVSISENVMLNGTGNVTGVTTFKSLLRIFSQTHSGVITVTKLSNDSGICILNTGIDNVKKLFHGVVSQDSGVNYYEKIFIKNHSYSNAVIGAYVNEISNPSAKFSFALENSKGGTQFTVDYHAIPTGVTVFDNNNKFVPEGYLHTGECIGVWIKLSLNSGESPNNLSYNLGLGGSIPSLVEAGPPTGSSSGSNPPASSGTGILIYPENFQYSGTFMMPTTANDDFNSAGIGLAFHSGRNSLFTAGHSLHLVWGEMTIPTPGTGTQGSLPSASLKQSAVTISSKISNFGSNSCDHLGGIAFMTGDRICSTAWMEYDAENFVQASNFVLSSTGLSGATSTPLVKLTGIGDVNPGYVGGYVLKIPPAHTGNLGAEYACGLNGVSISTRTSMGPCLFGFNPYLITSGGASIPYVPYLYYPLANPLRDPNSQNLYFNHYSRVGGAVIIEGTDTCIFFGIHGTGAVCYGDGAPCGDPYDDSKGYHAYPYVNQAWFYDINDFKRVRSGLINPWDVQPYALWVMPNFYTANFGCAGIAYDPSTQRVFLRRNGVGNFGLGGIHVYKITGAGL